MEGVVVGGKLVVAEQSGVEEFHPARRAFVLIRKQKEQRVLVTGQRLTQREKSN